MNFNQNPYLAARVVYLNFCPEGRKITPAELAQKMRIDPSGSGPDILERIGRHMMADPDDIPEFVAAMSRRLEMDG